MQIWFRMATLVVVRSAFMALCMSAALDCVAASIPNKTVVLTFDDAVKSHRTFVAPLLKKLGFGATFFVTHKWMQDSENFMTWDEIAQLHRMGFEIGNHTGSHLNLSTPKAVSRLAGELALVDYELGEVGVPKPVSFAYPGNAFSPEAFQTLNQLGYQFARRGIPPEVEYGSLKAGAAFDPKTHHRLLIPTAGDAYPDWTFDFFKQVVSKAQKSQAVVLQFHGVPDKAHPWVSTSPDLFRQCMQYLKAKHFNVIALRDLKPYLPDKPPGDPLRHQRYPQAAEVSSLDKNSAPEEALPLASEVAAARNNMDFWVENMRLYHGYSWEEIEQTLGGMPISPEQREAVDSKTPLYPEERLLVKPYPGGARHPRIGFLDGAIDPMRGTKVSVFLPWNKKAYVVIDVPEAIWSQRGLLFLAHTHIPTIWNRQHQVIENHDWTINEDGSLENRWQLPNNIVFGMKVVPQKEHVDMELWLKNGSNESLTNLRVQNCVILKGVPSMNALSNENKTFDRPQALVKDEAGHIIATQWNPNHRVWGNPKVPCLHSDPKFPNCPPGETVRVKGKILFKF